jgi:hypothetical protein
MTSQTFEELADYLDRHPNSTVAEIAWALNRSTEWVNSDLYANQDKLIKSGKGGRWHPYRWCLLKHAPLIEPWLTKINAPQLVNQVEAGYLTFAG